MSLDKLMARLDECLDYNPDTGVFLWKKDQGKVGAGDRAGCALTGSGARVIRIDGRTHSAHKLAWLLIHGDWPEGMIRFLNKDRLDLRAINMTNKSLGINKSEVQCVKNIGFGPWYYSDSIDKGRNIEAFS